jgi:type II secretory pathway component PulM
MKQSSTPLSGGTSELQEIKQLLAAQNAKIDNLAKEVEALKTKIG